MTRTAAANGRKRVLFISYAFPPVGGAGVQRVTKFIKYLHGIGWDASVLTVANPSVPVMDHSLGNDLPEATTIVRARTFEPGYATKQAVAAARANSVAARAKGTIGRIARGVLQPDAQVLWAVPGYWAGARHLRQQTHHAIVVSGPPFSTFIVGAALSRRFGVPLVLDYRDEWDLTNQYWENKQLGRWALSFQQMVHRSVVRQADALLATTTMSARTLESVCRDSGSRARVDCIYNGYDPADFAGAVPVTAPDSRFRLVYTGTLWAATSIEPLVGAVARLKADAPELASLLDIIIAGRITHEQQRHVDALISALPGRTRQLPYLAHSDVISLMQTADGLCLLLSDLPGITRVMPAKTFEYLAARKPIIAAVPDGEARAVLEATPHAFTVRPADTARLAQCLAERIDAKRRGVVEVPANWTPRGFDRPAQAAELARLLASIADARSRSGREAAWSRARRVA